MKKDKCAYEYDLQLKEAEDGTVTGSGLTSHGSPFTLTGRRDGTRLTFLQTIEGDTENDCEYNIIGETAAHLR